MGNDPAHFGRAAAAVCDAVHGVLCVASQPLRLLFGARHIECTVRLRLACLQRLADVHSSGSVWRFTGLLMALGAGRWVYSTDPWPLAASTHSQASASSVCAW